ncbi:hypothetical protein ACFPYI_06230 [Halomarina salina]|uniref:Pilin/flagellin n=1 Tax=Halomarina salina TaxID=1872699 RepID=A0ABD5RK82_9EURY|nr:hypothetical protein [Halomarina salina]
MRSRSVRRLVADDRAATPVVAKALEAAIVVLFIGLLTSTLFGGVLPGYRSTAGDAVGERALSAAAARVEQAVPATADATVRLRVGLPDTIRGDTYRVRSDDGALVLDHPHEAVDGRVPLALPDRVARVEGTWRSTGEAVIRVESSDGRVVVRLEEAER